MIGVWGGDQRDQTQPRSHDEDVDLDLEKARVNVM